MGVLNFFKKSKKRYTPADVKVGQKITVEWKRIKGSIGEVTCVNNDPKKKTMLIEVQWNNADEIGCEPTEREVWDYKDYQFENFHLLNELKMKELEQEAPALDVPNDNIQGDGKIEL